jgi:hypothetical protein
MTLTNPKPIRILPKVPGVAVIGLMVLQYVWMAASSDPNVHCELKIQNPHQSTYAAEYLGLDVVKLKITSECNRPQKYTEITATIYESNKGKSKKVAKFPSEIVVAAKPLDHVVEFERLTAPCVRGEKANYFGIAKGFAYLEGGQKFPVKGDSGKPFPVFCKIKAK